MAALLEIKIDDVIEAANDQGCYDLTWGEAKDILDELDKQAVSNASNYDETNLYEALEFAHEEIQRQVDLLGDWEAFMKEPVTPN